VPHRGEGRITKARPTSATIRNAAAPEAGHKGGQVSGGNFKFNRETGC